MVAMTDLPGTRQAVPPRSRVGRRPAPAIVTLGVAAVLAAVLVLVLVLVAAGGAPAAPPQGLPDPGPVVRWGSAVLPFVVTVLGAATIGFAGLVATGAAVRLPAPPTRPVALGWANALLLLLTVTGVEVVTYASEGSRVADLAGSVPVRALALQLVLAVVAALAAARRPRLAVLAAVAGVLPTAVTGHVRTDAAPVLAGAALGVHVVAASAWVGGLLALVWLAWRHRSRWPAAVPGYSRVALVCVVALGGTGVVVALQRLGSVEELVGSGYGRVVLAKAVLLLVLAGAGLLQRRRVVGRGTAGLVRFWPLAAGELVVMLVVLALASGLAQTPPPSDAAPSPSPSAAAPPASPAAQVPLPATLLTVPDLPEGYRAGHQHGVTSPSAPRNASACRPLGELVGTHPSLLQTKHPQVSTSFSKSHFGPEVTQTVIDYGTAPAAQAAYTRFRDARTDCARYTQSTSPIGANRYRLTPGPDVPGVTRGSTVRLDAVGRQFDGITWDVWVAPIGTRLVAVGFRSAKGGDNDDWAPAVRAALERLSVS